jgi:hypothetical protein
MATPKIGDVTCFDIIGFPPFGQKSVSAEYHPDGVELDATESRGGPFTLQVIIIDTLLAAEYAIGLLCAYSGGEPVKITLANGLEWDECYIGAEGPASAVVVQSMPPVIESGSEKVIATLAVSGHVDY